MVARVEPNQPRTVQHLFSPRLFGSSHTLLSLHSTVLKAPLGLASWQRPNRQILHSQARAMLRGARGWLSGDVCLELIPLSLPNPQSPLSPSTPVRSRPPWEQGSGSITSPELDRAGALRREGCCRLQSAASRAGSVARANPAASV